MPTTAKGISLEGLDPTLTSRMNALMAEVEAQGGSPIITSTKRDTATQQRLYNDYKAGKSPFPAAAPGTSRHERGAAMDVSGNKKTLDLMHQLMDKYGIESIPGDPIHFQLSGGTNKPLPGYDATTTAPTMMTAEDKMAAFQRFLMPGFSANQTKSQTEASTQSAEGTSKYAGTEVNTNTETPIQLDMTKDENINKVFGDMTQTDTSTTGSVDGVDQFLQRLGKQESGGNYNARNKDSGAFGKYQIMPSNWGSWAKEAGLPANAPQTPDNQELVVRFKVQQYFNQFGSWDKVAKAWYSGPGNVNKNVSGGQGYPDSNTYAKQVTG